MPLVIKVVRGSAETVYEQIAGQIRSAVGSGVLAAGSQLPSVRALAGDLGINLNTVARAYRLLQEEGFVAIQTRQGVCVVSPPASVDEGVTRSLQIKFRAMLQRMRQAGLAPEEIRLMSNQEIERLTEPSGPTK